MLPFVGFLDGQSFSPLPHKCSVPGATEFTEREERGFAQAFACQYDSTRRGASIKALKPKTKKDTALMNTTRIPVFVALSIFFLGLNLSGVHAATNPTVQTRGATSVGSTSVVFNGRVTSTGGGTITERRFDWGTNSGALSSWTNAVSVNGNDFSYRLSGLAPSTTYYFRAWAKNSAGWGNGSVISVTTAASVTVPSAPTGVSATDGTYSDKVRVTWNPVSGATYEVWRGTSSSTSSASKLGDASSTTYDNTTATPGTTYYYWVKAKNSAGTSGFSSYNTGYRSGSPPVTVPSAPTGVSATDGTYSDKVRVTWNPVSGATYEVWRGTSSSTSSASKLGDASSTTYDNTTAAPGTTYYYWVKAKNSAGTSGFSSYNTGFATSSGPANNNFASRLVIPASGGTVSGSNVNATKESGEPFHHNISGGKSVWWTWTPSVSGTAVISTAGSSFDTILAVYTGSSVGALTARASDDDFEGGRTSQVSFSVTLGTAYQIAVDGYNGASGSISLRVTPPSAVAQGWSDVTRYRHAETSKQIAIVAGALNGGNNRPSPQSIVGTPWLTDAHPDYQGGPDPGEGMRLAIQDLYDYWAANNRPALPLTSIPVSVQTSMRTRLSVYYDLTRQNALVERIRVVFNGTVPDTKNSILSYLGIRAQCKEFADRMVASGGGTKKTYGSTPVANSNIRPGMYAFKNGNGHAALIVAVYWDANSNPTKLRLAESNWGTGWAGPAGQVPWLRVVTTVREVPISDYYVVSTE